MSATILHGDCVHMLASLDVDSVDAIITDPPYELGFMGKGWDGSGIAYSIPMWRACLRVLKPGGHLITFGGTRTWHRMACAVEDAGFEIRDNIAWLYGSGFPKSLDVSKAIDKARNDTGPVRVVCRAIRAAMDAKGLTSRDLAPTFNCHPRLIDHWAARDTDSQPSLPTWAQWVQVKELLGMGNDLDAEVQRLNNRKGEFGEAYNAREVTGAVEEWSDRTNYALTARDGLRRDKAATDAAKQWQGWGTALKPAFEPIVVARKPFAGTVAANVLEHGTGALNIDGCRVGDEVRINPPGSTAPRVAMGGGWREDAEPTVAQGRWPANVLLDDTAAAELDAQSGITKSAQRTGKRTGKDAGTFGVFAGQESVTMGHDDKGGASRFFPTFKYQAKAPTRERPKVDGVAHPTVKPLELMRWLVRLITPPGGLVLDPFAGSGTTIEAALLEGMRVVGIEREAEYLPLIEQRIARAGAA